MYTSYKFRLYPNRTQDTVMAETLETCRRLYNRLLDDRIKNHSGFLVQKRAIAVERASNKYLKQVHSQVTQDVVLRLGKAFESYFVGLSRFPRFKRKNHYNSFTYPQYGGFRIDGGALTLSKIGKVKIRIHRGICGQIKTCTIVRDINHWYAVLASFVPDRIPQAEEKPPAGVDLGLLSIVGLSDGTKIPGPRFYEMSAKEIGSLQKSLSRKKFGARNREKARTRLAKAWRRVRNRRNDFAHKTASYLANSHNIIVFEDLKIGNLAKNHSLASAILDACWGKLRQFTAYKAERRGGRVILAQTAGTSQKCSVCGGRVLRTGSDRLHKCPCCGLVLDRDVNAARVILSRGLERAPAETEPLSVIRIGKFGQGSKKPVSFSTGGSLRKLS